MLEWCFNQNVRSVMSEDRLIDLTISSIERFIANALDFDDVMDKLSMIKARKCVL